MIVDTHAHIFSAAGPFAPGARYHPDYEASIEQWLALWPQAGVSHGVLVQPSFLGTDNSQLLAALETRPETLRGVVVIDPSVSKRQLQQWQRLGVCGVRLNLLGVADFSVFSGPDWTRLFGWMTGLGWHLEVQCEGERFASLFSVLKDVQLTLVIDHFGLPNADMPDVCTGAEAIMQAAEKRSIYVKLSAPYRLRGADPGKYASLYLAELGPDRLLWGSDWPWTNHERGRTYEECLGMLRDWTRSMDAQCTILQDTPKRLYGFGEE